MGRKDCAFSSSVTSMRSPQSSRAPASRTTTFPNLRYFLALHVDLGVLRPVGQLGGISYARITDTFELPREGWATAAKKLGPEISKGRPQQQGRFAKTGTLWQQQAPQAQQHQQPAVQQQAPAQVNNAEMVYHQAQIDTSAQPKLLTNVNSVTATMTEPTPAKATTVEDNAEEVPFTAVHVGTPPPPEVNADDEEEDADEDLQATRERVMTRVMETMDITSKRQRTDEGEDNSSVPYRRQASAAQQEPQFVRGHYPAPDPSTIIKKRKKRTRQAPGPITGMLNQLPLSVPAILENMTMRLSRRSVRLRRLWHHRLRLQLSNQSSNQYRLRKLLLNRLQLGHVCGLSPYRLLFARIHCGLLYLTSARAVVDICDESITIGDSGNGEPLTVIRSNAPIQQAPQQTTPAPLPAPAPATCQYPTEHEDEEEYETGSGSGSDEASSEEAGSDEQGSGSKGYEEDEEEDLQ
ncbi:hypothetical protein B0A55_09024 [Friedmanniomyces simplex]|uniref:Uncharacterized protein n=1 Tax=Friedmanniomyces simplex TaxID=329884 RepID=A0A4U0WSY7_9PEZI|nr:hypothetical protein B0A55_09024 [Friedmanniomyces simplex]